jgi:hypothetical protein
VCFRDCISASERPLKFSSVAQKLPLLYISLPTLLPPALLEILASAMCDT